MDETERKQKILEEIIQEAKRKSPKKQPGEFTREEFAKMIGCGRSRVDKILAEKIAAGIIKIRETETIIFYSIV